MTEQGRMALYRKYSKIEMLRNFYLKTIGIKKIWKGMFCNPCHWKCSGLEPVSVYQGCYRGDGMVGQN